MNSTCCVCVFSLANNSWLCNVFHVLFRECVAVVCLLHTFFMSSLLLGVFHEYFLIIIVFLGVFFSSRPSDNKAKIGMIIEQPWPESQEEYAGGLTLCLQIRSKSQHCHWNNLFCVVSWRMIVSLIIDRLQHLFSFAYTHLDVVFWLRACPNLEWML